MREFLFADCHKQLPFRETRRGMTHARPRTRPCPARTRRYGRRLSRVNASATRARPAGRNVVEEGRLEFHPASGYNYPGRTPASKVSFRAERGTPQFTHRVIVRSFANAQDNSEMSPQKLTIGCVRRGYSASGAAEAYLKRLRLRGSDACHDAQ